MKDLPPAVVKDLIALGSLDDSPMKLVGANVPLVRCLLHDPALNLSIGGKVYESPVFWELNFTNSTKLEDFRPH
jgi:hypothetical protein